VRVVEKADQLANAVNNRWGREVRPSSSSGGLAPAR
jgi:hypothetical protein